MARDEERQRRFEVEAQAASALNHPNICTVYEIGEADDQSFIAMALIEGTWTTLDHGGPTSIVYGTTGTLTLERRESRQVVRIGRGGGESQIVEPEPLPQGRATIAEEYLHHLETGDSLHKTLQAGFNLQVMALLDAGVRSAASGALETVSSAPWCIG